MLLLEANDLYRFYHTGDEETLALRGVSLALHEHELVVVMGPSGSGKSTLLACLAGLDEPDGGSVSLLGTRLTRRPEAERAARRAREIGIFLQSGNLFAELTITENILLQLRLARQSHKGQIQSLLEQVGLAERAKAYPSQLSGGELARAGLALALSTRPRVLLADEPTAEVDATTEADILALLDERRSAGGATLIVTHSEALATHADRILHLQDGRLLHD